MSGLFCNMGEVDSERVSVFMNNQKPVILSVDSDPAVLDAAEHELQSRYGEQYVITRAASGEEAIQALRACNQQQQPVALVIAGLNDGGEAGMDFLAQASEIVPGAKRVLLIGPANPDGMTQAMRRARIDNFVVKPWQRAEDNFYPVIDPLLEEWRTAFRVPEEGIRIIGYRWSAASHKLKNFLARNLIPYEWLEIEQMPEAQALIQKLHLNTRRLPAVLFPDGSLLIQPDLDQLADKIGLQQQAEHRFYDMIVVGGGPAGLSAAVYGASEGLSTLMIEAVAPGGQAGTSAQIDNYLGFPSGLSGNELTRRAVAQALRFGVEILTPQEAVAARVMGNYRLLELADGSEVVCSSLIIATGVTYRDLNVPGMESLSGSGIFYGAVITEAVSCTGKDVFILGGGNSAGQAAMYLTRYASSITMVTNTPTLEETMSSYLIDQIEAAGNIQTRFNSTLAAVHGAEHLEAVTVRNLETQEEETIPAVALFIYIGVTPRTDWLADLLLRDEEGYILTGPELRSRRAEMPYWKLDRDPHYLESSVPGIFAAGDTRYGSVKRIASSVGEGAMAVTLVHQYLAGL